MAIKYLSPTSLRQFETDPDEFVCQRVLRMRKFKQTEPMAIGSYFDEKIKHHLIDYFNLPAAEMSSIETMTPLVKERGELAYDAYLNSTGYNRLIQLLEEADTIDLVGDCQVEIAGIPTRGKTDLAFTYGPRIYVLDWKVNGFASSASPVMGYVGHPKFSHALNQDGVAYNYEKPLVRRKPEWIDQLSIYNLQFDENRTKFIGMIDQLVLKKNGQPVVAQHREKIEQDQIDKIKTRLQTAWRYIQREHYFPLLSKEESDARVEKLNSQNALLEGERPHKSYIERLMRGG